MEAKGVVVAVKRQWWLKVNTKPVRKNAMDGATFPHIIKVKYIVDGNEYIKRKWVGAGLPVPHEGAAIKVTFDQEKPSKAQIHWLD